VKVSRIQNFTNTATLNIGSVAAPKVSSIFHTKVYHGENLKKDTVDQTKELIGSILKVLLQDDVEFTVLGRVGKVDGANIRPVRICIEDADIRRKLLKKASSLTNNNKYEKIYVSPDLTSKQQEEDKNLRELV